MMANDEAGVAVDCCCGSGDSGTDVGADFQRWKDCGVSVVADGVAGVVGMNPDGDAKEGDLDGRWSSLRHPYQHCVGILWNV